MKEIARHIFDHALRESSIEQAFTRHVLCERGVLRICEDLYDLNSYDRVFVVAIGKAAHSMLTALHEQTGERFEGIVASPIEPEFHIRGFRYFHGGHPMPNAESIRAADAMLKSLSTMNEASLVIYLVSGGGSATAEKPTDDEISLDDLIETYRVLVHSGAPIGEINTIRKHLSATKGGRLAGAAYPAQQVSILVSDVPDSMPDALASGPTMPDSTTIEDCYVIASRKSPPSPKNGEGWGNRSMVEQFPSSVRELFEHCVLDETPKSDDAAFIRARWWTILSNSALIAAAATAFAREVHEPRELDHLFAEHLADGLEDRNRNGVRDPGESKTLEPGDATSSSLCTAQKKLQAKLFAYLAPVRTGLTETARRRERLQTEPHSSEQKREGSTLRLT